jgi:hypothetical protein
LLTADPLIADSLSDSDATLFRKEAVSHQRSAFSEQVLLADS